MKISKITIAWKAVVGFLNPFSSVFDSVYSYILDVANNFVASLDSATQEKIDTALSTARSINSFLVDHRNWCPRKWESAFAKTLDAFGAIIDALSDKQITQDEIKTVTDAWKIAYAEWLTDDSVEIKAA